MAEKNNNFFRCFFTLFLFSSNPLFEENKCLCEKHAEGVPETVEMSDGSRAPAERKIVGESITYGQAHRL